MTTVEARRALRDAVVRYAGVVHEAAPSGQHVVSPFGAYLLLALVGPAAAGTDRAELEAVLGMDAGTARAAVETLLAAPHPALATALGLWTAPGLVRPAYDAWSERLPAGTTRGPMPDQAGLDAWARTHTAGLIETFPLRIDPGTVSVLASALVTRVRWQTPFDVVPAQQVTGPWSHAVRQVLVSSTGHPVAVTTTSGATVGVHLAVSEARDLVVASVIAAPGVSREVVLRAAHEIAVAAADGDPTVPGATDLFELPIGDGPAWTLTEQPGTVHTADGRERRARAVMPAWQANTRLDLLRVPQLGFTAAARVLVDLLQPLSQPTVDAAQSARARYTSTGFEAAAVTAVGVALSARIGRPGLVRDLELRFAHPYAVVAVTRQRDRVGRSPDRSGPWHGLPVFSAWIDTPAEAEAATFR